MNNTDVVKNLTGSEFARYCELGNALTKMGNLRKAESCFNRAINIQPNANIYNALGFTLTAAGELDKAVEQYRLALALEPNAALIHSNLLLTLQYNPSVDDEELFKEHLQWNVCHGVFRRKNIYSFTNDRNKDKRLKIGYVSGDFRRHPVGYFLMPVMQEHDRSNFSIYCYYEGDNEDDYTTIFKSKADAWRVSKGLNDVELYNIIRSDSIDILIDLSGHTRGNRLTMFAQRPAPVQVSWLGYCGTTGLSEMDYLISDELVSPRGSEKYCSEKILRLPDSYLCYQPPEYVPEVEMLPALRNGFVTFGCFNNYSKLTHYALTLWGAILNKLPSSRLVIKNLALRDESIRKYCLHLLASIGIEESRVDLWGESETHLEVLQCYNMVDIALDTFPYSGATTTMESLYMGVPVVTLTGTRFCSRVSTSLLTTAGLYPLVAETTDKYIAIATNLAMDVNSLSSLRSVLRQRVTISPLCNGKAFTKELECAFRQAWQSWSNGNVTVDPPYNSAFMSSHL